MSTNARLVAAFLVIGSALASAAPPDVVLIVSDDQGWTDFGFMGHAHVKTPHLDRLAEQGLTYTRGYVPTSLCRASLSAILTGRYPHESKIICNDPPVKLPGGADRSKDRFGMLKQPEFVKARDEMAMFIEKLPTLPRELAKKAT